MPSTLVFPDSIRLARKDELPRPESSRLKAWERIQSANIVPGFVLKPSGDKRFSHYVEINVDAPRIWGVFFDLCQALLGPIATFVLSEIDDDPVHVGSAAISSILPRLEPHKYQLAHDGYLQFGLVSERDDTINEVFVSPTKHFSVWMNDEKRFRSLMERHDLREADHLEFLDQYPRKTVPLPVNTIGFHDPSDLMRHLGNEIAAISNDSD